MSKPATSSAYKPIIRTHLPACEGKDLAARCMILEMRDQATVAMQDCSDVAGPVFAHIEEISTRYAFSAIGYEALVLLGTQLRNLQEAAGMLTIFEKYDAV